MKVLISLNDIKDRYDIPFTMEEEDVRPHIISVQNTKLKPILCHDLYTEIETQSPEDYSEVNATLITYIVNYLCSEVYRRVLSFSSSKLTKAGPITFNPENTTQPSDNQIASMLKVIDGDIESYKQELEGYLYKNATSYPLYLDSECYRCKNDTQYMGLSSIGNYKKLSKYLDENEMTSYGHVINPGK